MRFVPVPREKDQRVPHVLRSTRNWRPVSCIAAAAARARARPKRRARGESFVQRRRSRAEVPFVLTYLPSLPFFLFLQVWLPSERRLGGRSARVSLRAIRGLPAAQTAQGANHQQAHAGDRAPLGHLPSQLSTAINNDISLCPPRVAQRTRRAESKERAALCLTLHF